VCVWCVCVEGRERGRTKRFSGSQEIPCVLWSPEFTTVFRRAESDKSCPSYSVSLKFIRNISLIWLPHYEFILCIFTQKKFLTKKFLSFIILFTFYCHWYKVHTTIYNHYTTIVISVQGYAYCSWCSAIIGNYMRIKLQAAHHWYNKIQTTLRQDTFTLHLQENHLMSSLSTEIVMKIPKNTISNCNNW
jgi:hypothetical protein